MLQITNSVYLAKRGDCTFTTKAKFAQLGGAAGLLVINDDEGKKFNTCGSMSLSSN